MMNCSNCEQFIIFKQIIIMRKIILIASLILGVSISAVQNVQAQTKSSYKIANKIHLDGDEKWDYLYSDDAAGKLYVSHGSQVQVIDEAKGEVVGKITGLFGVHGIAIVSDLNKGFISNGTDNSVTIFDTKTLEVITKVPVTGTKPDCIMYDSFSKNIFTMNGKTNNSTVINAETNKVIATIKFSGKPEFAVSNGKGLVYVNYEEESKIGVINTTTLKEETTWSIAPGEGPTGLALDRKNNRLFSVCANKMMVIVDATTGKIISTPTIGEDPDGVAFDANLKCAYSSSNMGTMTVVKEGEDGKYSVLENLDTQKGAKTIAVNRKTHHIYLTAANFEAAVGTAKPKIIPGSVVVLDVMPL